MIPVTRRVALTGGIATGKTHVRHAFEKQGVPTIDADTLAREAVAPGTPGLTRVVERFGTSILDHAGALDRKALGAIVFADERARRDLEAIVHPFVRDVMNRWFADLDGSKYPFAVADIPLLFETGRNREFDGVVVAAVDPAVQLKRLMERDKLTEVEARQRISSQLPIGDKVVAADFVIWTDGSFESTERQVKDVAEQLRSGSRSG